MILVTVHNTSSVNYRLILIVGTVNLTITVISQIVNTSPDNALLYLK